MRRTNEDKVIIHDFAPMGGMALRDKSLFGGPRMHQNRVYVASFSQSKSLAGSDNEQLNL